MIQRVITNSKAFVRSTQFLLKENSVLVERFIDKHKIVKRFFAIGIALNLYFCYDSIRKIIVLNDVSKDIK